MEQNNLVVTPDGKTWDEVTRDTSYIGNVLVSSKNDAALGDTEANVIHTEHRGIVQGLDLFNKDWAIAYDRFICLKSGHYQILLTCRNAYNNIGTRLIRKNGLKISNIEMENGNASYADSGGGTVSAYFQRGDYVDIRGRYILKDSGSDGAYSFQIARI